MKHIILLFLLFSISANADNLNFRDSDKQLHLITSYALTTSLYQITHNYYVAAGGTLFLGVGKELTDSSFSYGDLKADILGVIIGCVFNVTFHF